MATEQLQTDFEGQSYATVTSVRKLPGKHTVYDIEVAVRHRFYANGLLVHNCIGKYHPHGDQSVAGAIETVVNANVPAVAGKGNWGGLVDGAAAMRYTNARLSHYGRTFFDSDYFNKHVVAMVPNYDDTTHEPVSLPALLPNVLINGGEGIGVRTTTCLPTFTPESVVEMMTRVLKGEELTAKDYADTLVYSYRYGGFLSKGKENRAAWLQLFETGKASVQFQARLDIDRDAKRIEINDWPEGLNPLKFIEKVRLLPECARAINHKGDIGFSIEMRKDFNYDQFDKFVAKLTKMSTVRRSFKINVTHRQVKIDDGVVSYSTQYLSLSVPQLLKAWLRERLQLEKRSLEYRVTKQNEAIAYSKLLIFAANNADAIIKVIRTSPDPLKQLQKQFKLTELQANQILDLQLRKLSKLDQTAIQTKLKEQQAFLAQLNAWQAKPKTKVINDAKAVLLAIDKDRKYEKEKDRAMTVN